MNEEGGREGAAAQESCERGGREGGGSSAGELIRGVTGSRWLCALQTPRR